MLFDFHHRQNQKKPGSVHATYLITGSQASKPSTQANGAHESSLDDGNLQSSPFMSSSMPDPKEDGDDEPQTVTVVSLVKEELLPGKPRMTVRRPQLVAL